jgi:hypothetical protein
VTVITENFSGWPTTITRIKHIFPLLLFVNIKFMISKLVSLPFDDVKERVFLFLLLISLKLLDMDQIIRYTMIWDRKIWKRSIILGFSLD